MPFLFKNKFKNIIMTLNEAIKHCEKVALQCSNKKKNALMNMYN